MSSKSFQLPPFLTLPTEIRLKIYALVIPHSLRLRFKPHRRNLKDDKRTWRKTRNVTSLTATRNNKISLLVTSCLLHRESAPLFYGHNTFILEVDQYSFTSVLRRHILGYMRDVEFQALNLGRPSAWYQKRLKQVLGSEILFPATVGGKGLVFSNLRRLTLNLEGTDSFADSGVQRIVGRLLWEAGRGRLEAVVVVGKGVSGRWRNVVGVMGRTLGAGWVQGREEVGEVVWYRGQFKEGVMVCWVKGTSGKGAGGMVTEGLEGELRDVRL